jgi:hypothetical protein
VRLDIRNILMGRMIGIRGFWVIRMLWQFRRRFGGDWYCACLGVWEFWGGVGDHDLGSRGLGGWMQHCVWIGCWLLGAGPSTWLRAGWAIFPLTLELTGVEGDGR